MEYASFWNGQHPLNADYERLNEALVPPVGKCDTLQGELLRAAGKIGYDWYNNGWGSNNWSGARNFLVKYAVVFATKASDDAKVQFRRHLEFLDAYSLGQRVRAADAVIEVCVTEVMAFVLESILAAEGPVDNPVDMWELSESDRSMRWHDEDDEEDEEY